MTWSLHLIDPLSSGALSSGFFTRFVRGIHQTARLHRYDVALSVLDDDDEARLLVERLVRERWTDGVILMNPSASPGIMATLTQHDVPCVVLGRPPLPGIPSVDNDNVRAAYDATHHLLATAPGPVLMLNGPRHQTFAQDRADGYHQALRDGGREQPPDLVRYVHGDADAARREVASLLERGVHFGSVLAVSDALAIGALRAIREAGRRVPDDVAVMGMNNDDLCEYIDPPLSSVELNAHELGSRATALLLSLIKGENPERTRCLVPHRLELRESA